MQADTKNKAPSQSVDQTRKSSDKSKHTLRMARILRNIMRTRKTAGTAENPAANKYLHVTSKLYAIVTLHTFTVHRTVLDPFALIFGRLDIFLLSLIIRPKFWSPHFYPYPGAIFLKIESFLPWVRGKDPTKIEHDWSNSF